MKRTLLKNGKIIASLDIGSTKVSCLIAEYDLKTKNIFVLGAGQHASKGIKNSIITDMESLENSVLNAVQTAEKMANTTLKEVAINISGDHVVSEVVNVRLKIPNRMITEEDLNFALTQTAKLNTSNEFEIIHIIPISYCVDGYKGIQDPRGMKAENLICTLHVITAEKKPVHTLISCIQRCHLTVQAVISTAIASGFSVLGEDEADLGVTVIDLGGGNTHIALFENGRVVHTDSFPLGGKNISNDIAQGLSLSLAQAERIKTLYGTVNPFFTDTQETISLSSNSSEIQPEKIVIKKKFLSTIIQSRLEEIFEMVRDRLQQKNVSIMAAKRVVLTGGSSQIPGVKDLLSTILDKKVRLGKPVKLEGMTEPIMNPSFSTCVGLVVFYVKELLQEKNYEPSSVFQSVKLWLRNIF